ncbi:nucleoside hydrolase-like domain-containing protein [Priestia megaterium]
MNSVIRYLLYANEMDLEGIVLTSSMYHYAGDEEKGIKPYRWTGTDWLTNMLGAYEKAYPNLIKHADGYPKPDYIRSVTKIGNISNAGEMEKKTEGSEFLKDLFLDNNENDLYVQTWGGTNTTARALKSIQEEYEKSDEWEKIKKKVSDKLVLYIILDQDESYNAYIAKNWPDIRIINDQSNFWHFAYAWKNHTNEVNSKLQGDWNYQNIKNGHGTLMDLYALMGDGKIIEGELSEEQRGSEEYLKKNPQYNRYDFISEGDSPSFFYLIDNGLRSMENPTYGGWGGRFGAVNDKLYRNTVLDYDIHTKRYETEYSLMRWFDDIQNDFAARADWVIASKYDDANHNPTLKIKEGLDLNVNKGEKITLHATGKDPDGDNLTYKWWRYFEADTYEDSKVPQKETKQELLGDLLIGTHRELAEGEVTDSIKLSGSDTNTVTFTIPEDAKSGDTIHIIAEVQDDGAHGLKHYQRVILTVK